MPEFCLEDIDWNILWQQAGRKKSWKSKGVDGWDRGIANIAAHKLAWEDDWRRQGITPHDLTIASRSLAVRDLRSALERLTRYARRAAVFLHRDHVPTWAFIRWTPK